MFSSVLSWAWLALGLLLRTPGSVQTFSFVILFPLTSRATPSSTRRLELVSAKPLRSGVVAMHYRRAR